MHSSSSSSVYYGVVGLALALGTWIISLVNDTPHSTVFYSIDSNCKDLRRGV